MKTRAAATGLTILALAVVGNLGSPSAQGAPSAQPKPTATPTAKPGAAPTAKPAGAAPAATAPRAGGFPVEAAIPLLSGGVAALGGGLYLIRRARKP